MQHDDPAAGSGHPDAPAPGGDPGDPDSGNPGAPGADMDAETFRRHGYAAIDRIAAFLDDPERWPVLPDVQPGAVRDRLPGAAPSHGESMDAMFQDFDDVVMPATTHWNHPGFLAYFAITGSGPGILAELLAAGLNVNAMLWRTGPAATEIEEVATRWLARLVGLPDAFDGVINDTASSSTLYALAAARELQADLRIREEGMAGRPDVPRLRVYCSEEAHSSVDKAVLTLGLGLAGVRRLPTDEAQRLRPAALEAAIREDRAAGIRPLAVVATVGTTSTTAVDPVPAIADICEREGIWLHVDAAYGGAAAALPELRWVLDGVDRAHSVVINPHKWLFVPVDCSVLYTRRPDLLRGAFSLVPEYLTTTQEGEFRNLMDYGVALGRRFRGLKLWFVLRHFGVAGIQAALRRHVDLARTFAGWIDEHPAFERLATTDFSVVVFRYRPPGEAQEDVLDRLNSQILQRVNDSGRIYLSHTRVGGRYALRLAVGNIRTELRHLELAWQLATDAAECSS